VTDHRPAGGGNARNIALLILHQILRGRRRFEQCAPRLVAPLAERDRQFVRLLVLTTLRRLGEIDHIVGSYLERPLKAPVARDLLRLGAAQSLYLQTPAYAVVDTMVGLAGRIPEARPYKNLVNAVLRRIATATPEDMRARIPSGAVGLPDWMWKSWVASYGLERASRIALSHLQEPPLDITARATPEVWAQRLNARLMPMGSLRRMPHQDHISRIADLPYFHEGSWWVQDLAASLPVKLMGGLQGQRVLDLCAAPGGKTLQLASGGAQVTALERSRPRLSLLEENLARTRLTAQTILADAVFWKASQPFDAVLLDAPCSATGTLRRHPDVAWIRQKEELPGLTGSQDQLLDAAARQVRPGGMLVYCVCSLQHQEGEDRVAAFLARTPGWARRPVAQAELPGLEMAVTPAGDVRTLPFYLSEQGGLDGFYIARLGLHA
jgi:16S rRNA (cytosine967-C5)-methyltransferase